MSNDMDVLRRAYERENDSRDRRPPKYRNWAYYDVGASRDDIKRLLDEGMLLLALQESNGHKKYRLSDKGRDFVSAMNVGRELPPVPAANIIAAMDLVVGFDDVKEAIARAIESQRRIHFLLEGPPASIHGDTEVWVDIGSGPQSVPISNLDGNKNFRALAVHPQKLKSDWYLAEVSRHDYAGDWIEITAIGTLPFKVTATHSLVAYDPINGYLIPKKAGELKVGELLPLVSQWSIPFKYPPTLKVSLDGAQIALDKELGFVLGFWLGDGGLSQGKTKAITFSNYKKEALQRVKFYLAKLPGHTNYAGGVLSKKYLFVQNQKLYKFLKEQFICGDGLPGIKGRTARWKKLPGWVLDGPDDFVRELLHGYFFADGTVANGVISATSVSPTLVRDIAMLLTRIGITPGIQHRSHDAKGIVVRQCDATQFMNEVGKFRENKAVSTDVLMHDESFKVPFPFDKKSAQSLTCSLRKGRRSQSLTRRAATELLATSWPERLKVLLDADIRWVRVEYVRHFRESNQAVYDLSIPEAETFVLGNRVLVHNCAKSILLEAVRSSVPGSYIAFGSRTSSSGLSDVLFEKQPTVLLMDEADKMRADCFSVLLGLMEGGEILETKSGKVRGLKLETVVIGACNSSAKFPPEFLSRFALHIHFPKYTRDEFIEVCRGFLSKAEGCPPEVAATIGKLVHDYGLGDVRKARGVWQLMTSPKEAEMHRVIQLMLKYSKESPLHQRTTRDSRLPGI